MCHPKSNKITVSINASRPEWSRPLRDHLTKPLLSKDTHNDICNVTFVCDKQERIKWNGLAYLASLSKIFRPRSREEQNFMVFLPDYGVDIVKKLLFLLAMGVSIIKRSEIEELSKLTKDLGVSFVVFNIVF